ncbi:MAG: hypothetical protein KKH12_15905 [Gammaproteobacteria bacterium]|nr:hypothetical protein [Gammaproteobacteria bacterium]
MSKHPKSTKKKSVGKRGKDRAARVAKAVELERERRAQQARRIVEAAFATLARAWARERGEDLEADVRTRIAVYVPDLKGGAILTVDTSSLRVLHISAAPAESEAEYAKMLKWTDGRAALGERADALAQKTNAKIDRAQSAVNDEVGDEHAVIGEMVNEDGERVPDPRVFGDIERIRELRGGDAPMTFAEIAAVMNAEGRKTQRGSRWTIETVHYTLKRAEQRGLIPAPA